MWLQTIVSGVVGSLISYAVAYRFYAKAGRDLKNETERLSGLLKVSLADTRKLQGNLILILRAWEKKMGVKFAKDEHGNYKGLSHELSAKIEAKSNAGVARLTVSPASDNESC